MDFSKPQIMGVLNITPDSFSDGGLYFSPEKAREKIYKMMAEGVDIIDIGGESTRPDSQNVSPEEELARVKPVIDSIAAEGLASSFYFSIDTNKAEVAEYAVINGFEIVNDVTALRGDRRMPDVLLRHKPFVVLMYSKDHTPRTMRRSVKYKDVVKHIQKFLAERITFLSDAGFSKDKIIIDPGMGAFVSSDPRYSFEILERLAEFKNLGCPILVGISRKLFVGSKSKSEKERDEFSAALSFEAIKNGASIIRTHNVALLRKLIK